jgi:hypothetical protein
MNKEANVNGTCLFDGAKFEMNLASSNAPIFGLCFPRPSFVVEREQLDLDTLLNEPPSGDWPGWGRLPPSDSDRLRVNKKDREVLYFWQPPPTDFDVTMSGLRMEICNTLKITDLRKIALASGPFYWGPGFKEDGLGLYNNHFKRDMVVDSRHMKTVTGAALIDVIEVSVPSAQNQ